MIAMRRAALVAIAAGTLLATASAVAAQDASSTPAAADPVLAFREPAEGASIVGEVTIAVKLTPPDAAGVEVVITVDGRELCTRQKPPFYPTDFGLYGKPTLVNNVETLCNIPRIMENGASWFSEVGTEKCPGRRTATRDPLAATSLHFAT